MLELATQYDTGEPVRIRNIAEQHGIPARFLVQILLQLKGAGLVASTRGASGGYKLIKNPAQITSSAERESAVGEVLLSTWQTAADAQNELLNSVTFADLVEQASASKEGMYYI